MLTDYNKYTTRPQSFSESYPSKAYYMKEDFKDLKARLHNKERTKEQLDPPTIYPASVTATPNLRRSVPKELREGRELNPPDQFSREPLTQYIYIYFIYIYIYNIREYRITPRLSSPLSASKRSDPKYKTDYNYHSTKQLILGANQFRSAKEKTDYLNRLVHVYIYIYIYIE